MLSLGTLGRIRVIPGAVRREPRGPRRRGGGGDRPQRRRQDHPPARNLQADRGERRRNHHGGYALNELPAHELSSRHRARTGEPPALSAADGGGKPAHGRVFCPRKKFPERLRFVYSLFPRLEERRSQPAGTLSGGEQQMCAIARALMCGPKLLLLDEPSAGLAPVVVQSIFALVKRICAEGYTVLIVEQNVQQVLKVALGVGRALLVLDRRPLAMPGHASPLGRAPGTARAHACRRSAPGGTTRRGNGPAAAAPARRRGSRAPRPAARRLRPAGPG